MISTTTSTGEYDEENGHKKSPSLEKLDQERHVACLRQIFARETGATEPEGQRDWDDEDIRMIGISQCHKNEQNMTQMGTVVRSEKSQNTEKSSLPEVNEPNATESGRHDAKKPVLDAEETTESRDVATRELKEVKIDNIEEPNEERESCNDVAKNPFMDGVAEDTTELCDDIASEPVMEKADAEIPRVGSLAVTNNF